MVYLGPLSHAADERDYWRSLTLSTYVGPIFEPRERPIYPQTTAYAAPPEYVPPTLDDLAYRYGKPQRKGRDRDLREVGLQDYGLR